MQPLPPPPPPRPDLPAWQTAGLGPAHERPKRPQQVTAAGAILVAMGCIQALAGVILVVVSPADLARIGSFGNLDIERIARGVGVFSLGVGVAGALAGFLVLRLVEAGRILALVISFLLLLGGFGSLARGSALSIVSMGLYGFVVYALFAHGAVFRRSRPG